MAYEKATRYADGNVEIHISRWRVIDYRTEKLLPATGADQVEQRDQSVSFLNGQAERPYKLSICNANSRAG